MKRDEKIREGESGTERRRQEQEARRIWKRYKRCMWWVDDSNPMLPGVAKEPDEPRIREPNRLLRGNKEEISTVIVGIRHEVGNISTEARGRGRDNL